ncbi:MAG: transcription termination factor NusA [Patescibacteria group bacterium]|nr:transcription termination factor NusA [Patescibacteria group bacterium]
MSEITNAIKQICEEKNLSYEAVLETIESALAAAYRKDFGEKNQNIKVEFDPEAAKSKVFDMKTVVEDMPEIEEAEGDDGTTELKSGDGGGQEDDKKTKKSENKKTEDHAKEKDIKDAKLEAGVAGVEAGAGMTTGETPAEEERKFNPKTELQIKDAKLIKKTAKVGDVIKTKLAVPAEYGRMAAQTAKQVIIQKLREAERGMIFSEFKDKENEVLAGVVQRREGRVVLVDLGKTAGVLPAEEQIAGERYRLGDRLKVYVKYVGMTPRGPEIVLSRTSDEILKKVFYLEIPEISNGLVEIKAVAREAGNRSKVAVMANGENVDPIGSCVGQRGSRIQTIISELGGEKIDIIEYNEDAAKFIAHALAPARVLSVELNQEEKRAVAKVAEDQLSLAIGREGQNVRLAAKLTGWKLDIVGEKQENNKTTKQENKGITLTGSEQTDNTDKKAEATEEKKAEVETTPLNPSLSEETQKAEAVVEVKTEAAEVQAEPVVEKPKKEKKSKKKII